MKQQELIFITVIALATFFTIAFIAYQGITRDASTLEKAIEAGLVQDSYGKWVTPEILKLELEK